MNNNWIFTTQTCFLTGGQNRRFGYGYSSFKGKRASVEDFFETQIAEVEGQMVAFFGVFDGHGGSTTAEYVKNNLFKNLSSHPLLKHFGRQMLITSLRIRASRKMQDQLPQLHS